MQSALHFAVSRIMVEWLRMWVSEPGRHRLNHTAWPNHIIFLNLNLLICNVRKIPTKHCCCRDWMCFWQCLARKWKLAPLIIRMWTVFSVGRKSHADNASTWGHPGQQKWLGIPSGDRCSLSVPSTCPRRLHSSACWTEWDTDLWTDPLLDNMQSGTSPCFPEPSLEWSSTNISYKRSRATPSYQDSKWFLWRTFPWCREGNLFGVPGVLFSTGFDNIKDTLAMKFSAPEGPPSTHKMSPSWSSPYLPLSQHGSYHSWHHSPCLSLYCSSLYWVPSPPSGKGICLLFSSLDQW